MCRLLPLPLLLISGACQPQGGDEPGGRDTEDTTSGVRIGPEGGRVVSDDGLVVLDVPAGALGELTEISITATEDSEAEVGETLRSWDLAPDGLTFSTPAALTITAPEGWTEAEEGADVGYSLPFFGVQHSSAMGDEMLSLAVAVEDESSSTITTEISHFSAATLSLWNLQVAHLVPLETCVGENLVVRVRVSNPGLSASADEVILSYSGDFMVDTEISLGDPAELEPVEDRTYVLGECPSEGYFQLRVGVGFEDASAGSSEPFNELIGATYSFHCEECEGSELIEGALITELTGVELLSTLGRFWDGEAAIFATQEDGFKVLDAADGALLAERVVSDHALLSAVALTAGEGVDPDPTSVVELTTSGNPNVTQYVAEGTWGAGLSTTQIWRAVSAAADGVQALVVSATDAVGLCPSEAGLRVEFA